MKEFAVVYINEYTMEIAVYCEVETEQAGWELANELNKKGDGYTYWVEGK